MSSTKLDSERPGWQTSEFWLTLVAVILTAILSSGAIDDVPTVAKVIAAIVAALAALGYTGGRAVLKGLKINAEVKRDAISYERESLRANLRVREQEYEVRRLEMKEREEQRRSLKRDPDQND